MRTSSDLLGSQNRLLQQLNQALKRRALRIARFARVACPALGTTLASDRLDRWFSLLGTVASKALPQSPIFEVASDIGDFIAAVIKERTDPKTLPGVEAMMPESPFIKLIIGRTLSSQAISTLSLAISIRMHGGQSSCLGD